MHWNITLLWLAVLIPLTAATTASLHPVLNQVLNHYSEADDSLKRKAATFLFKNMEGHSYMTFDLAGTRPGPLSLLMCSTMRCSRIWNLPSRLSKIHAERLISRSAQ